MRPLRSSVELLREFEQKHAKFAKEASADFWEMIEQRRREPAVSLEKVEAELFDEGDKGKAS